MMYIMKKKHVFWTVVCLLLSLVPEPLKAYSEEEDDNDDSSATVPPVKIKHMFCAYKADDGPCKALMKKFFFNIFTKKCEEFIYGGCLGNENRFDSVEECEKTCILDETKINMKKTPEGEKPDFCFLEDDVGLCRGFFKRYFYNTTSKQCDQFVYGGCFGNQNNFESLEDCKNMCENPWNNSQADGSRIQLTTVKNLLTVKIPKPIPKPTKVSRQKYRGPSWCLTPADSGLCKSSVNRYYYNSATGKCQPFSYTGCGGNENNFTSELACMKACKPGFMKKITQGKLFKTKRRKASVKVVYEN